MDQINHFLEHFQTIAHELPAECDYWFAVILFIRFMDDGSQIVYDYGTDHFATFVKGRVYDITGDVTDGHDWVIWRDMKLMDEALSKQLVKDRILFVKEEG